MSRIVDPLAEDNSTHAEDLGTNGKPKRNLKVWLLVLASLGLAAFLIFGPDTSQISSKPKEEKKVEASGISIADDLKAKEAARPKPTEVATPSAPTAPTAPQQKTKEQIEAELIQSRLLREQSLHASEMTVNGVVLAGDLGDNNPQTPPVDPQLQAQDALLARAEGLLKADKTKAVTAAASQGRDLDFLSRKNTESESIEAPLNVNDSHGKHALYQGHIIRTVLLRGINSDLPGSMLARTTSDVYDSIDGRILLIPKGSLIYGEHSSDVAVGQSRVMVAADRIIFPNGKSIALQKSTISDTTGYAGLNAKVDNHFFQMFGTSLLVGMASWLAPTADQSTSAVSGASGTTTSQ